MTIPTSTARNDYVGSGITGPYPVTFKFFADADLEVVVADTDGVETTKVLTSDYTVTGAGVQAGGSITFTSAIPADYAITVQPKGVFTQDTDIRNEGGNLRVSIEDRFDRLCRDTQVLQKDVDRSVKVQKSAVGYDATLPTPEANSVFGWDEAGTAIINYNQGVLAIDGLRGRIQIDTFSAGVGFTAGSTTTLTLTTGPRYKDNCQVTFDGIVQHTDTYSTLGTTLTFSSAIPTGTNAVEVRVTVFDPVGVTDHEITVSEDAPTGVPAEGEEWVQIGATAPYDIADLASAGIANGELLYKVGGIIDGTATPSVTSLTASGAVSSATLAVSGAATVGTTLGVTGAISGASFTGTTVGATGLVSTPVVSASSSAGIKLQNSSGNDVLLLGAGPGTGITAYGQINGTALELSGGVTCTTLTASGDIAFALANNPTLVTLGANDAGSYSRLRLRGNGSQVNWQIGASATIGGGLEFTPSTATGGSTYTAPAAYFTPAGAFILGTDPGGSDLLRVGGSVRCSELIPTTVRGRGNDVAFITSRNAADTATIDLMYLDSSDQIVIGGGSYGIKTTATITAASVAVAAADYVYWGPAATDGTWRYGRSGNDFVIQRRESGSYVTKQTIAA